MPTLHRAIDLLAMWTEDRKPREPVPFRPAPAAPLDCFGPLTACPDPPERSGTWTLPSPRLVGFPGGDRVTVHVWRARHGAGRGVAILVPPWKIGKTALVERYRRVLARAGFEAWLAVPPHHLDRVRAGAASGEGFVSPDVGALRASFEQLVLELRLLIAAARTRGGEVALLGLSLGALAAALAVTAPEQVDLAALVAPPDLGEVFDGTPIGRRYRALAARAGAPPPDAETLRPMLDAFRPALRRPTARRIFLAAGRHDAVAPPAATLALARAWGVAPRLYPRGHLTLLFACAALRRDLTAFLAPPDGAARA
jgi:predicted alpha/beta hydrolase family esterase